LLVNKSLILSGNFWDFSKRGPEISQLQNGNSRWLWFKTRRIRPRISLAQY